jgi:hypothetical protein
LKSGRPFANDIAASCGGPPGETAEIDREYARRSPLTRLADAAEVPLDINAGIRDGHDGSVPVGHSIRAFNAVARPGERVSEENLQRLETLARVPDDLARPFDDPSYGVRKPLFRRQSGSARLTIFDGGHEIVFDAAFEWLSRQKKQPR